MGTVGTSFDAEARAAIALSAAPRFGPATIRELIDACGSARAVLRAASEPPASLAAHPRLVSRPDADRLRSLLGRLRGVRPVSAGSLAGIRERGVRVVTYGTAQYPPGLGHLHHPPPVLYLRGRAEPLQPAAVAIVGTRRATEYGRRMARDIAGELARAGHPVVSGLARGIDAAAHRATLAAGGVTIGVLGSGLDHRFPSSSADLYRALPERGLLVSEFPPEVRPRAGLFPRRNRIIAGLACAVVVVQAGQKSGALITVGHALELGRDVFAVPGPVGAPGSEGVHGLLRDGAAVATCAADVLEVVGAAPAPSGEGSARVVRGEGTCGMGEGEAAGDRARLTQMLEQGIATADGLAAATGLPVGRALALLGMLELEGHIEALPGGRFAIARPVGV